MKKVEWISRRCDPTTLLAHHLMEDNVVTCRPTDSTLDVAHKLYDRNFGSVPVVDEANTLVGMVTEFDLLELMETGKDLRTTTVSDIMTRELVTVTENTPFLEITKLLQRQHLIRVPVVRGEKLVGILARQDVILGYIKATDVAGGG